MTNGTITLYRLLVHVILQAQNVRLIDGCLMRRKKVPVIQPFVLSVYNRFMEEVDRMDQNV